MSSTRRGRVAERGNGVMGVRDVGHTSDCYEDDDGWLIVRCTCGFLFGPVPDNETAMDVLMEHAAEAAR